MRWRCDAFHVSRLVVPTIPAVTVHLLRFQEDRFSWLTKIAKETRGVLTFPRERPQNLPGPRVLPACVALCVQCALPKIFSSFKEPAAVMDCCEPQEDMTPRLTPSREVLRTRTQCPGCGKVITYHALAYKHKCPRIPNTWEGKKQRQLAALHARINARIPASEPQAMPEPAVV
jgi:hypothetical protein